MKNSKTIYLLVIISLIGLISSQNFMFGNTTVRYMQMSIPRTLNYIDKYLNFIEYSGNIVNYFEKLDNGTYSKKQTFNISELLTEGSQLKYAYLSEDSMSIFFGVQFKQSNGTFFMYSSRSSLSELFTEKLTVLRSVMTSIRKQKDQLKLNANKDTLIYYGHDNGYFVRRKLKTPVDDDVLVYNRPSMQPSMPKLQVFVSDQGSYIGYVTRQAVLTIIKTNKSLDQEKKYTLKNVKVLQYGMSTVQNNIVVSIIDQNNILYIYRFNIEENTFNLIFSGKTLPQPTGVYVSRNGQTIIVYNCHKVKFGFLSNLSQQVQWAEQFELVLSPQNPVRQIVNKNQNIFAFDTLCSEHLVLYSIHNNYCLGDLRATGRVEANGQCQCQDDLQWNSLSEKCD